MGLSEKDMQIIQNSAGRDAAVILAGIYTGGTKTVGDLGALDPSEVANVTSSYRALQAQFAEILTGAIQVETSVAAVVEKFPGAETVAAPQAPQQPSARSVPGADTDDEHPKAYLWKELYADMAYNGGKPENWWDNRHDKKGPNSPDFKQKKGTGDEALWLNGKWNAAPGWFRQYLASGASSEPAF